MNLFSLQHILIAKNLVEITLRQSEIKLVFCVSDAVIQNIIGLKVNGVTSASNAGAVLHYAVALLCKVQTYLF